jgi:hypothetical protein
MSEDTEGLEAPKSSKTPAQLETIKKARAKKAENDEARMAEKERLKAEARFDRLLSLFDVVRIETPEPEPEPPKPKAKPKPKPKPKPMPLQEEEYEPEEESVGVQKPKVRVKADPNIKTINLRFC